MSGWSLGNIGVAAGAIGVALALLCLLAVWLESLWLTHQTSYKQPDPESFVFTHTPETEAGLPFEDISFPTANGKTLRGWLVPASMPTDLAIVTFHGAGGDRRSYLEQLGMFHEHGATVLMFDMRETGLSDGDNRGIGLAVREAEDAIAAVEEMHQRGFSKVLAYGCSLGGSTAILAAAADKRIDGIIVEASLSSFEQYVADKADRRLGKLGLRAPVLSGISRIWGNAVVGMTRWRLNLQNYERPVDVISKIAPRPVLLIHGGRDLWVIPENARRLVEESGQSTDYWHIEDAEHCGGYSAATEEYRERVASFIQPFSAPD